MNALSQLQALLRCVLPGGKGLVLMLKFYADESVCDEKSVLTVAGCLLTDTQFTELDTAFRKERVPLPYFHMKEGHYRSHPDIYRRLVGLIKPDSVTSLFVISVNEREYGEVTSVQGKGQSMAYWMGGAYTFCLNRMMGMCGEWVSQNLPEEEYIAYFFEGGHPRSGEANFFFQQLYLPQHEKQKEIMRYISHTFVDGKGPIGSVCQACDILAWNTTDLWRSGVPSEELQSMLGVQNCYRHYDKIQIQDIVRKQIDYYQTITSKGWPKRG